MKSLNHRRQETDKSILFLKKAMEMARTVATLGVLK